MALQDTSLFSDATLQAYYKAEDVNDSKNSNTLTNNNTVAFNPAKFDNGFDFGASNTNKSVSIASNLNLSTYQAGVWSWAGWINVATAPGTNEDQAVFYVNNNSEAQLLLYYSDVASTKRFRTQEYNGSTSETLNWDTTLSTSTWHHVVYVKNGTTTTLYLNNSSLGNNTQTLADASPGRPDKISMGYNIFDSYGPFKGLIDDVGFFTKALSPSEVSILYNSTTSSIGGGAFFLNLI